MVIGALAVGMTATALAAIAGKPVVEAFAAVASAGSAVAAWRAASASLSTAREARRALALHFRPTMVVAFWIDPLRSDAPLLWRLTPAADGPQVRDVRARYCPNGGPVREMTLAADQFDVALPFDDVPAHMDTSALSYAIADLTMFEVTCTDVATGNRWLARLSQSKEYGGIVAPNVSLDFELI